MSALAATGTIGPVANGVANIVGLGSISLASAGIQRSPGVTAAVPAPTSCKPTAAVPSAFLAANVYHFCAICNAPRKL